MVCNRTLRSPALAALVIAGTATAAEVRPIDTECEVALALSAAPAHLRSGAGVYVLGSEGYERVRDAQNGFTCIVERNHRDSIVPQCFDKTSESANLAAILDVGKQVRMGKSFDEAIAIRQAALENGDYPTPGHGIAYMISDYNYIYNHRAGVMLDVEPHLMFHAPHLTAEDIGADAEASRNNRGLPTINAQGPHGFMISFVEKPSDSADVIAACGGQLPDRDEMQRFPPRS